MVDESVTPEQLRRITELANEMCMACGGDRQTCAVKLTVRKGRFIGACASCDVSRPPQDSLDEFVHWLNRVVSQVARSSGYGEVEIKVSDGDNEAMGCRVEVSYGLKSL